MDINHSSSSSSCCRHQEISQAPSRRRRTADDRQQMNGSTNHQSDKSPRSSNRSMVLCLVATSIAGIILQMVVLSHVTVEASAFGQQQQQLLRPSKTYTLRSPNSAHAQTAAARPFKSGQKQTTSTQVMMSRIRGGTIVGGGSAGGKSFGGNGIASDNNLGSPSSSKSRLAVSSSIMGPTTDHRQENQQQPQLQDQQQYPPSSSTLTTKMKNHRTLLLLLAVSTPVLLGTLTVHQNFVVSGITSLFASYRNALIDHPLTSKVLTGATLAIIGDFVAQYTTWSSSSSSASSSTETSAAATVGGTQDFSYDKRRAVSFAVFDACYRVFQNAMFPAVIGLCKGNVMKQLLPVATTRVAAAIERTLLYQLVIVPTLYYPVFFIFTGFIQGLSLKETLQRMKSNYFKCWGRNLQVRSVIRPSKRYVVGGS